MTAIYPNIKLRWKSIRNMSRRQATTYQIKDASFGFQIDGRVPSTKIPSWSHRIIASSIECVENFQARFISEIITRKTSYKWKELQRKSISILLRKSVYICVHLVKGKKKESNGNTKKSGN